MALETDTPSIDPLVQAISSAKIALDGMSLLLIDRLSIPRKNISSDRGRLLETIVNGLARALVKVRSLEGGEAAYQKVIATIKELIKREPS